MTPQRVVVTGLGVASCLGCEVEEFWRRLIGGEYPRTCFLPGRTTRPSTGQRSVACGVSALKSGARPQVPHDCARDPQMDLALSHLGTDGARVARPRGPADGRQARSAPHRSVLPHGAPQFPHGDGEARPDNPQPGRSQQGA